MKRSTFCFALVLTLLCGVSAAGARSDQKATPQHQAAALPKLTCSIKGIVFGAAKVALAPKSGCFIGKKSAPSSGKWSAKSYDVTASPAAGSLVSQAVQPCYYGSGAGLGKSFNAPSPLKYIQVAPKYDYPGLYQVSFTLSAHWGKQKASVTKTALKRSPSSNILCGPPPKMMSVPGPAGACIWNQFPKVGPEGLSTQGAEVGCPSGNGTCVWQKNPPYADPPYFIMGYGFKCTNGYDGHLGYQLGYALEGASAEKCEGPTLQRASMYPLRNLGPGSIYVYAYVDTFNGGTQLHAGPINVKPTDKWGTDWFRVNGSTSPC